MDAKLDKPLSDAELIVLDNFLLSLEDDETLSIDEAHGFLTALTIARNQASPEERLQFIWGQPNFKDAGDEEKYTHLLLRLNQEIKNTLQAGRLFEPLVTEMEDEDDVFVEYEGWCFGFMLGVAQEQEKWDTLPKEQQELLTPIGELALIYVEEETELDDEDYETLVELIPGSVASLYRFWQTLERHQLH